MKAAQDISARVRPSRPPTLDVNVSSHADGTSSSTCPGTPREYRERHQKRFAIEQLQRHGSHEREGYSGRSSDSSSAQAVPSRESEELKFGLGEAVPCRESEDLKFGLGGAAPSKPRLRGSASMRAISAARALHVADAVPLPGAAWPGHSQNSSMSQPAARASSSLPPRPRTPPDAGVASPQRPTSRSGLPPRPPMLPSRSRVPEHAFTSCARALDGSQGRNFNLGILCH